MGEPRRREGLPIEAAQIHDLKGADRQPIDVSHCRHYRQRANRRGFRGQPAPAHLPRQPRPPLPPLRRPQPLPLERQLRRWRNHRR